MSATLLMEMLTVKGRWTLTNPPPSLVIVTSRRATAAWSKLRDLQVQRVCLQVRLFRELQMALGEAALELLLQGQPLYAGRHPPRLAWDARRLHLAPFPSGLPSCQLKPQQCQTPRVTLARLITLQAVRSFCMVMTYQLVTIWGLLQSGWASLTHLGAVEEGRTGLFTNSRPSASAWLLKVLRRTLCSLPTATAWWRR